MLSHPKVPKIIIFQRLIPSGGMGEPFITPALMLDTGLLKLIHTYWVWHVSMKSTYKKHRGFTLLEFMIALVVLGVLVALAAPSFQRMVDGSSVRSCSVSLVTALNTARADAVNLRRGATLTANATTSGNEWGEEGWSLTYPGATETKNFESCESTTATEADGATTVTFDIQGRPGSALTFEICHDAGSVPGRQITVNRAGLLSNQEYNGCSS